MRGKSVVLFKSRIFFFFTLFIFLFLFSFFFLCLFFFFFIYKQKLHRLLRNIPLDWNIIVRSFILHGAALWSTSIQRSKGVLIILTRSEGRNDLIRSTESGNHVWFNKSIFGFNLHLILDFLFNKYLRRKILMLFSSISSRLAPPRKQQRLVSPAPPMTSFFFRFSSGSDMKVFFFLFCFHRSRLVEEQVQVQWTDQDITGQKEQQTEGNQQWRVRWRGNWTMVKGNHHRLSLNRENPLICGTPALTRGGDERIPLSSTHWGYESRGSQWAMCGRAGLTTRPVRPGPWPTKISDDVFFFFQC